MKLSQPLLMLALISASASAAPAPVEEANSVQSLGHLVKQPHKRSFLEIQVLGGQTFKIGQISNPNLGSDGVVLPAFKTGPLDLFRAYSKFGASRDPDNLARLIEILRRLGLLPGRGGIGGIGGGGKGGEEGEGGIGNGSDGDGDGEEETGDNIGILPEGSEGGPVDFNDPNFNGTLPDDLDNDDAAGDVDAIPDTRDKQFLCPVQIGNPPQTLNLNFDTGSSDLWVFSTETPTGQVAGQSLYNPALSSTSEELLGEQWQIRYGDGSGANGGVYLDTVTIGGITVEKQAVEVARAVSASFAADEISDGLVGLGFNTLNQVRPTRQNTFWQNALETLAMPLFSANLKAQEPGNYNFGFIDPTEFAGEISFVPVTTARGFWEFTSPGFRISEGAAVSAPHQAIADTGTTLLLLPDDIVAAYYSQVQGAADTTTTIGGWTFPCNAQLPDYTAIIGDYEAVVPGEFINFAPADNTGLTCFGGIQSSAELPFAIYGGVFLKSQFVVFHGGESELGLAAKPLSV